MVFNFGRAAWRLTRRCCRSELALVILVLLLLWYFIFHNRFSSYNHKSTNFEATEKTLHNEPVNQKALRKTENGARTIGFRDLEMKEGASWSLRYKNYAVYSVQGRRNSMEDRFSIIFNENESLQMFGIFDGHGGTYVANKAEEHLLNNVMSKYNALKNTLDADIVSQALIDETVSFDKNILQTRDINLNLTGSTALFGVLDTGRLHIANLGDCRAIAVQRSDDKVVQLTTDHKPNNEKEAAMVKSAGGSVIWNGVWRVGGILAVSRALGDGVLKIPGWITAVPEVKTVYLHKTPYKFLLLASDGLWDVISSEEAAEFVEKYLHTDDLFGARQLVETALKRSSMDNITVMIIKFD